ncbi:hypothetical protein BP5796_09801 [Coleophoma crateriformis]|uniref:Amidase domain-containing protein n=1 Tax=Coleophoma crateriformis TaxID=565419 RepID=A0A3D8QZ16_9HELO|nr:hypothetical protein BP5796_09801 [Coleophoma crateriformis]
MAIPSLIDIALEDIIAALDAKSFTSVDLVAAYIARISEVNDEFHAVIEINPDAKSIARQLDEERSRNISRGPLHGIPLLIKDNVVTLDKMECTSGSLALVGARPCHEASVITRLRKAGVILLGKTNLSEWSNFRSEKSSSGWSPRGGQTYGAYLKNSQPSGSSSGSAVAVALGLTWAALGTETTGSIIGPAETNNVIGFKPTRGLISTDAVIPVSIRQDVIGTLTRTVKDAAHLLGGFAGRSEFDKFTWNIPFDTLPDYAAVCNGTNLQGFKIGVPRNAFMGMNIKPAALAAFELGLKILTDAGAQVVENTDFKATDDYKAMDKVSKLFAITTEFKTDIQAYLSSLDKNPNNIHNLDDLIAFTEGTPEERYPEFDIGRFHWTKAEGADLDAQKYKESLKQDLYFGGEGGILGAMEAHNLDLIVIPTVAEIPIAFAAKVGYPLITVPLGFYPEGTPVEMHKRGKMILYAPGIPYCITFISKAYSEETLLKVAHAFEQLTLTRKNGPQPYLTAKTEISDILRKSGRDLKI